MNTDWTSYEFENVDVEKQLLSDSDEDEIGSPPPWYVYRISVVTAFRVVLFLPLFAFIFAVSWAMYEDFEKACYPLCSFKINVHVNNYLPSMSAAIGDFELSQTVWKICIILHAPFRFYVPVMYFNYLRTVVVSRHLPLAMLTCMLNVVENIGLVGLTLISSKDNLPIHVSFFTMFIVSSELYMILMCLLFSSKCRINPIKSELDSISCKIKRRLTVITLLCSIFMFYTYMRHEAYCEPGVYTIFALCEYIVVLCNMGFHYTAVYEHRHRILVIDLSTMLPFRFTNS